GTSAMLYDKELVSKLETMELVKILSGETHYPVTVELVNLIYEIYKDHAALSGLLGSAVGSIASSEEVLDTIARIADQSGDSQLRSMAAADEKAGYRLARSAFPGAMSLLSIQSFIWKHSIAENCLWSH